LALAYGDKFAFSTDGEQMAVVRNPDSAEALSTNNDVYLVELAKAVSSVRMDPNSAWDAAGLLSAGLSGGGGNDDHPSFSPDGRLLAYRSMSRPGCESDTRQIMLHDLWTGAERCLTCGLDRSAGGLAWSQDSRFLYFGAYDREASALYRVEVASGTIQRILRSGSLGGIAPLPDGRVLLLMGSSRMPEEIFVCDPEKLLLEPERWGEDLALQNGVPVDDPSFLQQLTFHNRELLDGLEMNAPEHFWYTGALGDSVHGFILRPPFFAKVPLVLVMHGGPQWAYHDFWLRSYNFQMIAAQGYAVATVNFHGSAGFGITFQDAIRGHWGDVPGEDVERGLDYIFANYDFVDSTRVAAIGRSYGGYLANWLNGHSQRFRCLVAHSGGFDEATGWGTTEELWFPEWEFGGVPWEHTEVYAANSPSSAAAQMRTPTLIIHGQRDYRVDLSDGLQVYTVLRRQGVDARFLTFDHQGHHIHDPESWKLMWNEIFGWLARYL
ncbi:S9 family peptidase, partial [Candidatus Eisenbacteria bacterium]